MTSIYKYILCISFAVASTAASGQLEETPMDVPPGTEQYHGATESGQVWHEPNPRVAREKRRNREERAKQDHPITMFFVEMFVGIAEIIDAIVED